ncbi:hypothetical protein LO762_26225 [Actinocorallia sp. API 0066]|uniref:hypothetical protein n=1 Tax=Actinocorallia sp. API 0066 TaxID=2896846 RepID=UPI001E304FFD|nr:hypothetical protein [Actinocorallia sp. API 0066]MCD0452653.1 hypothetical protein [Actinocorallia sp. API 0066]
MKAKHVRVGQIHTRGNGAGKAPTHRANWQVGGRRRCRSFRQRADADAFRNMLQSAVRCGAAFDEETGLPKTWAFDEATKKTEAEIEHLGRVIGRIKRWLVEKDGSN